MITIINRGEERNSLEREISINKYQRNEGIKSQP